LSAVVDADTGRECGSRWTGAAGEPRVGHASRYEVRIRGPVREGAGRHMGARCAARVRL